MVYIAEDVMDYTGFTPGASNDPRILSHIVRHIIPFHGCATSF